MFFHGSHINWRKLFCEKCPLLWSCFLWTFSTLVSVSSSTEATVVAGFPSEPHRLSIFHWRTTQGFHFSTSRVEVWGLDSAAESRPQIWKPGSGRQTFHEIRVSFPLPDPISWGFLGTSLEVETTSRSGSRISLVAPVERILPFPYKTTKRMLIL